MHCVFLLLILIVFPVYAGNGAAPYVGETLNGKPCSGNTWGYGPFDYSKRNQIDPEHLSLVEGAHFKPDIENLLEVKHRSGSLNPWPDLDYTLRAWPNHPRALLSIIRFQIKINNKLTTYKADTPAECYLQRAIHFSPDDPVPYALYGHYLHQLKLFDKADQFYSKAINLEPRNVKFAYSYSLLLIDMKRYDEALKYAKIAYSGRKTPKKLKDKLKQLGVWE